MLNQIPVVEADSLRALDKQTVQLVGEGFHYTGFIFIRNPEVTVLLPKIYKEFGKVFNLSEESKKKYCHPELYHQRGWTPPFTEHGIVCRSLGLPPDSKENWFIGPELRDIPEDLVKRFSEHYIENIWPEEVPGFKPATLKLYDVLYECGLDVLRAVGRYLLKPDGYFEEMVRHSPTVFRPIKYPAVKKEDVGDIIYGCRHTDINFATVLPASTKPGLWIKRRGGVWIPGNAPENCLIAQVGDMLQYLTAGKFLSAWHEVRAPEYPTNEPRLSGALFIHARSDVIFDPGDKRYPAITAGELLLKRLRAIGLA